MKHITVVALALTLSATPIFAESPHLKPGYVACDERGLFDQFITAETQKDERGMKYLIGRGCFPTSAMTKFPVSYLAADGFGVVKVRVYASDADAFVMFTNAEALPH